MMLAEAFFFFFLSFSSSSEDRIRAEIKLYPYTEFLKSSIM